jgi:phosphatidate cytidylyltransferase
VALDKKTFRTRTLTAIVFAAVMLLGLFTNFWAFTILFLVIMFGCLVEYVRLIKKISPEKMIAYLPLAIIYIIMPVIMMLSLGLLSGVYIAGPGTSFLIYSPLLPCAIIFSIWINDTMAYIVGSLIGKTPFSKISPKKTWEGTGGGAILCVVVIGILGSVIPAARHIAVYHWIAIAAICAVFGTMGDLLESKIKRMANVKDSGSFMPGHGGFLDRFDSLLIATPVVWLYVKLFM